MALRSRRPAGRRSRRTSRRSGAEEDVEEDADFASLAAVYLASRGRTAISTRSSLHPSGLDRELDEPAIEAPAAWARAADEIEDTRVYWRWHVTAAFPAAYAVTA